MPKQYIIFIILWLGTCIASYGQSYAPMDHYLLDSLDLQALSKKDRSLIDSVLTIYHESHTDTSRINAISIIVEESWDDNVWPRYNQWVHDFVMEKLGEDADSVTLRHLKKSYAAALNNIGYLNNSRGNIDEALANYEKTLEIQHEIDDQQGMAGTLINTGYIFLNQGMIEKALEYYYRSLKIQENTQDEWGIATALNGIGYIFYKQGETEKAFENYSRSLEIRKKLDDEYGVATCLNNIGLIFKDRGEWTRALEYYQKCLGIQEKLADQSGIATTMGNIALVYKSLGDLEKAFGYYSESLAISEEINDKLKISYCLNSLAGILLSQGYLESARVYALKSLKLANELNYPVYIRDAAETLSSIAKKQTNWQQALFYHELHIQMRDSIFSEETITAAIRQEYKYKYEKRAFADSISNLELQKMKEAQLAASEAEKDRLHLLSIKQRQQSYFLIISLSVVLLFIGIVYSRLKVIKTQKRIIERQKEELEDMNRELKQFANVTSHDLKTPLRGIANLVTMIEKDYPDLEGDLERYFQLMRERAVKMHELINGILAYSKAGRQKMMKGRVNLDKLLKTVIDQLNNEKGVKIKVTPGIPDVVGNKTQLEQVFSNLLGNAIKYNHRDTGEGKVEVGYSSRVGFHEFTVSDNGPGIRKNMQSAVFDLFKKSHQREGLDSTGIGLSIVQKLVTQNGGKITLSSDLGQGATFRFTWPK